MELDTPKEKDMTRRIIKDKTEMVPLGKACILLSDTKSNVSDDINLKEVYIPFRKLMNKSVERYGVVMFNRLAEEIMEEFEDDFDKFKISNKDKLSNPEFKAGVQSIRAKHTHAQLRMKEAVESIYNCDNEWIRILGQHDYLNSYTTGDDIALLVYSSMTEIILQTDGIKKVDELNLHLSKIISLTELKEFSHKHRILGAIYENISDRLGEQMKKNLTNDQLEEYNELIQLLIIGSFAYKILMETYINREIDGTINISKTDKKIIEKIIPNGDFNKVLDYVYELDADVYYTFETERDDLCNAVAKLSSAIAEMNILDEKTNGEEISWE